MSKNIKIYTDGACSGNPGPGGWGVLLQWNGHEKELFGGEAETTNNRMEMQAVIEALKALKRKSQIDLYTDSVYVQKGITEWIHNWKAKNWPAKIKNKGLWQAMDTLVQQHDVTFHWVKGHAGHPENERADELARRGIPR
jgi:ribonuclease HI